MTDNKNYYELSDTHEQHRFLARGLLCFFAQIIQAFAIVTIERN